MLFSKKIIILALFLFFVFPQISHATWACGDALVDSRDSKSYITVQIGTQCWMRQNINVGTLVAGSGNQGTSCETIQKYCYSNNEANCTTKGGLYQWDQAMCGSTTEGAQGICPDGWHIPTDAEFKILVEGQATPGCESSNGEQCSPAGSHLSDYTLNHDNSSGFSALLSGYRFTNGSFYILTYTWFWSSTQHPTSVGEYWYRSLYSTTASVERNAGNKLYGFSLRCLQDPIPNAVPTLTSVADSPDPIEGGETITITPTGQADTESDALYYYCNETGATGGQAPTAANTLCTQANTSYASTYTGMTCSYPVSTGNTTRTVYCRAYDGTEYSTERTTTYTVDTTAPTLSETTPVTTPTTDTTPNYIFNTNEAGTITYGGDCTSSTSSASSGSNTITFSALAGGTHSNCTITVTDSVLNASSALPVTTFYVATVNIPTTLEASYTPGVSDTITTTWSANSNLAGTEYYIENTTAGTNSGWTTATTYTFTGLNCNTSYSFKVKSRDSTAVAESAYTDPISKTIICPGGGGVFSPTPSPTPIPTLTPTPVSPPEPPALTREQLKQKLIELITQLIQMLMARVAEMRK